MNLSIIRKKFNFFEIFINIQNSYIVIQNMDEKFEARMKINYEHGIISNIHSISDGVKKFKTIISI